MVQKLCQLLPPFFLGPLSSLDEVNKQPTKQSPFTTMSTHCPPARFIADISAPRNLAEFSPTHQALRDVTLRDVVSAMWSSLFSAGPFRSSLLLQRPPPLLSHLLLGQAYLPPFFHTTSLHTSASSITTFPLLSSGLETPASLQVNRSAHHHHLLNHFLISISSSCLLSIDFGSKPLPSPQLSPQLFRLPPLPPLPQLPPLFSSAG